MKTIPILLAAAVASFAAVGAGESPYDEGRTPKLRASLVDPEKKAKENSALVSVKVDGVTLVDPERTGGRHAEGQGHLQYKVDDGPVIVTASPQLSFHGLTPGRHAISVTLAGNDHAPLGPSETISITIPEGAGDAHQHRHEEGR